MGRKAFEPTQEQRRLVESLAGFGIPQEDMRQLILNYGKPISVPLLEEAFRRELDTGVVKANAQMAGALFKKGIAGDTTAMIFWLKTRAKWREVQRLEHANADGVPFQTQAAPTDLSALSPKELEQLEGLLAKTRPAAAAA